MNTEIDLANCEAVMTAFVKTKKGMKLTFLIQPNDITPIMQLMPLDEPMTLRLSKMEVGI